MTSTWGPLCPEQVCLGVKEEGVETPLAGQFSPGHSQFFYREWCWPPVGYPGSRFCAGWALPRILPRFTTTLQCNMLILPFDK